MVSEPYSTFRLRAFVCKNEQSEIILNASSTIAIPTLLFSGQKLASPSRKRHTPTKTRKNRRKTQKRKQRDLCEAGLAWKNMKMNRLVSTQEYLEDMNLPEKYKTRRTRLFRRSKSNKETRPTQVVNILRKGHN